MTMTMTLHSNVKTTLFVDFDAPKDLYSLPKTLSCSLDNFALYHVQYA